MHTKFSDLAWEEYEYWAKTDVKTLNKINRLLDDIDRNGNMKGLGKPEPLKGDLSGYFSRRIDDCNRLVYKKADDGMIYILQCRYHYSK